MKDLINKWLREDLIEKEMPSIMDEWHAWLDDNFDPGNYDAYKDRSTQPPTWLVDTYMPPHIFAKLAAFRAHIETGNDD